MDSLKRLPEETIDDIMQNVECTLIKISGPPKEYSLKQIVKLRDDCHVIIGDIDKVSKNLWDYYALPYNK